MTLTFRIVISRSFESGIYDYRNVFTFDFTGFRPHSRRISTINHDTIIGTINFKAVTFDLDLENEKKNGRNHFLNLHAKKKTFWYI